MKYLHNCFLSIRKLLLLFFDCCCCCCCCFTNNVIDFVSQKKSGVVPLLIRATSQLRTVFIHIFISEMCSHFASMIFPYLYLPGSLPLSPSLPLPSLSLLPSIVYLVVRKPTGHLSTAYYYDQSVSASSQFARTKVGYIFQRP